MTFFKSAAIAIALIAAPATAATAIAEVIPAAASAELPSGDFVRKSKRLEGSYTVVERDGATYIQFSDDFRAARGPDLKIFLSPKNVADTTGQNATEGSLLLGELTATRGTQEYRVPEGVNLSDFGSVLVHCEEFSVLWGGSNL